MALIPDQLELLVRNACYCRRQEARPGHKPIATILAFLSLIAAFASASPRAVSEAEAQAVCSVFARTVWGAGKGIGCWPYADVRGEPGIYLCEWQLDEGTSMTLMVGARTDMPPVLLYYSGRPLNAMDDRAAQAAAERALGRSDVRCVASVYYSPLDLWFEYQAGDRHTMVSLRDLTVSDPARVRSAEPLTCSALERAEFERQWSDYLSGKPPLCQDGQHRIADVPNWDWHYGCAPTAAANVLAYWAGHGFGLLVDSVLHNVADPIEGDVDSVPNVSQQLAIAMATDTLISGVTTSDSIAIGIAAVCADPAWGNGYYFSSYLTWNARQILISEIDNNRPGVLALIGHPDYGNHAVTYCGWGPPDQNWIVVRDEWFGSPQDKVIYYGYGGPVATIPVVPGGSLVPDIGITAITQPGDRLEPGLITPQAWVSNFGKTVCTCRVFFSVGRTGIEASRAPGDYPGSSPQACDSVLSSASADACYSDSASVALSPGSALPVTFSSWYADLGRYQARCSVYQATDQKSSNNTVARDFLVTLSGPDTTGTVPRPTVNTLRAFPNPTKGDLGIMGWRGPALVGVYSPDGRRVISCRLAADCRLDVSCLPTGLYLLRLEQRGLAPAITRFAVAR